MPVVVEGPVEGIVGRETRVEVCQSEQVERQDGLRDQPVPRCKGKFGSQEAIPEIKYALKVCIEHSAAFVR